MTKNKDVNELLINEVLREELIGRVEVLSRVKVLLLLPNTEFATTQQVADFYEVDIETVNSTIRRNIEELSLDGLSLFKREEVLNFLNGHYEHLDIMKGKTVVSLPENNELIIGNRGMRLFPRRAILRVGMLLRDSSIAKEVRTQLLNIEEKTVVEVKMHDINEEQNLILAISMAKTNGDLVAFAEASTKMMGFKNRHIVDLQTTIGSQQEKVDYCNHVLNPPDLMNTSVIAKDFGMSGSKLNEILKYLKVIYKQGKTYMPYAKYQYLIIDGYCDYDNFYVRNKGISINNLKWTEKGRMFIADLLKRNGLLN